MNDIMKIVQDLQGSNILLKGVIKKINKKIKKIGFPSTLLGALGASLLGNLLAGKGIVRAGSGSKEGKRIVRDGYRKNGIFNAASFFNDF